jgi:hypothetical protein
MPAISGSAAAGLSRCQMVIGDFETLLRGAGLLVIATSRMAEKGMLITICGYRLDRLDLLVLN